MKTGDRVIITCDGEQYAGHIILASSNEVSLMLGFEAIIDGHVGMMPVLRGNDGVYRSLFTSVEIGIRPWTPDARVRTP